jgi:hypothetical protein
MELQSKPLRYTNNRTGAKDRAGRKALLDRLAEGYWGPDPTIIREHEENPYRWTDRLRMILISAVQIDKAVLFSALITLAGFVPLFTMQGVEGQIFGPMARTYGYALAGAIRTGSNEHHAKLERGCWRHSRSIVAGANSSDSRAHQYQHKHVEDSSRTVRKRIR